MVVNFRLVLSFVSWVGGPTASVRDRLSLSVPTVGESQTVLGGAAGPGRGRSLRGESLTDGRGRYPRECDVIGCGVMIGPLAGRIRTEGPVQSEGEARGEQPADRREGYRGGVTSWDVTSLFASPRKQIGRLGRSWAK